MYFHTSSRYTRNFQGFASTYALQPEQHLYKPLNWWCSSLLIGCPAQSRCCRNDTLEVPHGVVATFRRSCKAQRVIWYLLVCRFACLTWQQFSLEVANAMQALSEFEVNSGHAGGPIGGPIHHHIVKAPCCHCGSEPDTLKDILCRHMKNHPAIWLHASPQCQTLSI